MPALVNQMASSPLPFLTAGLITEGRQAREALLCSCDVDLGYFEQAVLGAVEATGARVTVVGDAHAAYCDPRTAPGPPVVQGAGTRYVHGLAAPGAGGAFHAKVVVVAGRERALVAIGSGDLTPGGWGGNEEFWTVATADREACPELVADVADWLRSLERLCRLTPLAASGISRTAALLEELAIEADLVDTGHRLVHSSARPVASQLPGGAVDSLLLYAPSYDERTAAAAELIATLRPARATLAVQSGGRTVIQPTTLRRVIAAAGIPVEIVVDTGERYRHAALIEAVRPDGGRWALTGSTDLSPRALLTSADNGGNIEVGVVSCPAASLFTATARPVPLEDVPAVRQPGGATAGTAASGAVLLSAARTDDGLEVTLARPADWPTPLEASPAGGFDAIGSVPAGAVSHLLAGVHLAGGTRVRCAGSPGPVVFVQDPELVLLRERQPAAPDGAGQPGPAGLIADARLLEGWLAGAAALAARYPDGGPAAGSGDEGWLSYADDARASLGAAMFRLATGELPSGLNRAALAAARDASVPERRKVRQLLTEAVGGQAGSFEPAARIALLALVLCGAEAGVWNGSPGPDSWTAVAAEAVRKLASGAIPGRLATAAASWAALAVYLMHEQRASGAAGYEEARTAAAVLLPGASAALVADLAAPFTNGSGFPVDPEAVMHLTGLVAQEDPLADAMEALSSARPDWSVHRHGARLLHVESAGRGTFLHAAEALERVPGNADAAVWATGSTPSWAIAARFDGALFHVESDVRGQLLWRHYRLGPLASPTALARNPELATRSRVNHGALKNPFPEAIAALVATGVDLSGGAPSDCPD